MTKKNTDNQEFWEDTNTNTYAKKDDKPGKVVDVEPDAVMSDVSTDAGYKNSLGYYSIGSDGTIQSVQMVYENVHKAKSGNETGLSLDGSAYNTGFFIIADGFTANKDFKKINFDKGEIKFVFHHGEGDERLATIYDQAEDIALVYTKNNKETVIQGKTYHATLDGEVDNLNPDGLDHAVITATADGDHTTLSVGFEDLYGLGDKDFNDVRFDVTIANQAPTAQNDEITGVSDNDLTGNVLADNGHGEDTDIDGDTLSVVAAVIDTEKGGHVVLSANGDFVYTPAIGFIGTDSFTYTLIDAHGLTVEATVTLNILDNDINDTDESGTVEGTDFYDDINAQAGNDVINAGGGNDIIQGGSGADVIYAGTGNDTVDGGEHNDDIFGGDGDDVLNGGIGNDIIYGEDGADVINGGDGKDFLFGGEGNDIINAGDGNDNFRGDAGDDVINAGAGDDRGYGNEGDDIIHAEDGNDYMEAGTGNDTLYGDAGDDTLFGNEGNDTIHGGDGLDKIYGGTGNDTINGGADNDLITGEEGDDTIHGDEGDDLIYGEEGLDLIYGDDGVDKLYGGTENDTIYGGNDNDMLLGQSGDDTLYGDAGNDTIYGGTGNDTIYGGGGEDSIWGGTGADTFVFQTEDMDGTINRIKDFQLGDGDTLDITDILVGFDPLSSDINDYLVFNAPNAAGDVSMGIDRDGAGDAYNFAWVAKLGTTGDTLDAQTMIDNGNLII